MRDPYKVLDVPRSATEVEIKKSFRRLAKGLHPDANTNDPVVATPFAELNSAYEILGDKKKRKAFDGGKIDADGKPTPRRPIVTGLLIGLMLVAIATLIIRDPTLQRKINATGDGRDANLSRSEANKERAGPQQAGHADRISQSEARIIQQQSDLDASDDAVPLSLQVSGQAAGLALEIRGLPTGTTISVGRQIGEGRWRILASDVDKATVQPPAGFGGTLEITVELRRADDTIVDSGQFRLPRPPATPRSNESAGEPAISDATATNVMTVSPPAERDNNTKKLTADRDQIELLIERSQELMSEGDTGGARLLLQPAAEAGDARAALALGATYDPIMLSMLRAPSVAADVALAREWYKQASALGSQDALERLRLLASASVGGAEVVTERHAAMPTVTTKPRQHTIHSPNHAPVPPNDPNGVYIAGERVGSDPDPNIRAQLLRDDASRELRTDTAGRQLVAQPDSTNSSMSNPKHRR
jgi:DnaJ domain